MVDYLFAPRVIFVFFVATIFGFLILRVGNSHLAYMFAAVAFGLSLGAEMDVLSYMVSRYFPAVQFGKVFGLMFSAFMLGSANGPLMLGKFFDRYQDYNLALLTMAIIATVAALSTFLLPRFKTNEELAHS